MNAKKLQQINQKTAYQLLNELLVNNLWDPVVTNRMSDSQCVNRLNKAINEYLKNNLNIIYWSKSSYMNIPNDNKEVIPMMKNYNFHKYKEDNNL